MSILNAFVKELGENYAVYLLSKALREESRGFETVVDDGSPGFWSYSGYDQDEYDEDYEYYDTGDW